MIYFVIEKTAKKYENIRNSNKVALAIDTYGRNPKSVNVQGYAEIIESGKEYERIAKLLAKGISITLQTALLEEKTLS